MHLREVKLRNFRGFKEEIAVPLDEITAFVGKNDSGKSTILEALAVFFGEQELDCDDAHIKGDKKDVAITCVFYVLPINIILDSEDSTDLAGEHLLRPDGLLEVEKTFNCAGVKPKPTGVFVVANYPSNPEVKNLHALNNVDLKKKLTQNGASEEGVDKRSNPQIRKRLWEHAGHLDLKLQKIRIDVEDTKGVNNIWQELEVSLPAFALFKSDRASTDQDDEAQNPMNAAVKEAIKAQEAELKNVTQEVEKQVQLIAEATIQKMKEMNPTLANVLKPTIKTKKWESLFSVSLAGDEDVPINKRGSGFRRLVLLNFFRAKAERDASDHDVPGVIYAFEEPETSQHPDNQKMLMGALLELSKQDGCQVLLSTHTPALGDMLPVESVRYIECLPDGGRKIHEGGRETYTLVTKALGILPDNRIKAFVAVEGSNDINFLCGISSVLHADDAEIVDLAQLERDGTLVFIPLGGGNLKIWANRLSGLNRPEFHLYDRDEGEQTKQHQVAAAEVNKRTNCKAVLTSKREIENYLHPDAIAESLGVKVAFNDNDDVPTKVAEALHKLNGGTGDWATLKSEKQKSKSDRAKQRLNTEAVSKMSPARIAAVDPSGELRSWLLVVGTMVKQSMQ